MLVCLVNIFKNKIADGNFTCGELDMTVLLCLTNQGFTVYVGSASALFLVCWCAFTHQLTRSGQTLACSRHLNGPGQLRSGTVRPCREKKTKGAKMAHLIKEFLVNQKPANIKSIATQIQSNNTTTSSGQLWQHTLYFSFPPACLKWCQELNEILFPSPCCAPL